MAAIVIILLLAVLLYAVYRLTRSIKPKLTFNPQGNVAKYVPEMKVLREPYKPTPWLLEGNMHTVVGMRFRSTKGIQPTRENINYEDGGLSIIDWFEMPNCPQDAPVVIICHTLGGGSREPCTRDIALAVAKKGWRAVTANLRGSSGAKVLTNKLYNALEIEDLEFMVDHITNKYNKAKAFFMVGFSLGSYQTVQYATAHSDKISAFACVSHPYDSEVCTEMLEHPVQKKLYLKIILDVLKRVLKKSPVLNQELVTAALKAQSVREFDDAFTAPMLGMKSHEEYYKKCAIYPKIAEVKKPLILINSDDDPFTKASAAPEKEVAASDNVLHLRVAEGGHVSFLSGLKAEKSYAEEVILDWFSVVGNVQ